MLILGLAWCLLHSPLELWNPCLNDIHLPWEGPGGCSCVCVCGRVGEPYCFTQPGAPFSLYAFYTSGPRFSAILAVFITGLWAVVCRFLQATAPPQKSIHVRVGRMVCGLL